MADTRLAEVYPRLVDQLVDLFTRARAVDDKLDQLGGGAAGGGGGFLVGGGRLAEELGLPRWGGRREWPPPRQLDPAWFAPAPFNPRYSADWAIVREAEATA